MNNKRCNLMIVMLDADIGGSQMFVLNLVKNLDRTIFNVCVCCIWKGGELEKEFEKYGVTVHVLNKDKGFDLKVIWKLAKLFIKYKIDVVHSNHLPPLMYVVPATWLSGCKNIIHTEHSFRSWENNKKYLLIAKVLFRYVQKIVGVCSEISVFISNKLVNDTRKIITIENGVDVEAYSANVSLRGILREDVGINNDDFVIGMVGRLDHVKNHELAIDAIDEIKKQIPYIKLLIIGDGPIRSLLEARVNKKNLNKEIKFLGNRRDIISLLKLFDVFLLTSLSEGMSVALLEAMAAGKAVIVSDVGGNIDLVQHGYSGLIFESNNMEKLRNSIEFLYKNKAQISILGGNARNCVLHRFSLTEMVRKYESLYQGCIDTI